MSATQIMTTVQSRIIQKPRFLRLVGSSSTSDRVPSQHSLDSPSLSGDHNGFLSREKVPKTYQQGYPLYTSFDFEPEYLSRHIQKPRKSDRLQTRLRRKYYQYEVTWGLYVPTPAEKVIVNSLVLLMFFLVLYGASQIAFVQYAWTRLWGFVSGMATTSTAFSQARGHVALHFTLVWVE